MIFRSTWRAGSREIHRGQQCDRRVGTAMQSGKALRIPPALNAPATPLTRRKWRNALRLSALRCYVVAGRDERTLARHTRDRGDQFLDLVTLLDHVARGEGARDTVRHVIPQH